MDPNIKFVNGKQEPVTETQTCNNFEKQYKEPAIISSEAHIHEQTGLNTDTAFVNTVNDAEEMET